MPSTARRRVAVALAVVGLSVAWLVSTRDLGAPRVAVSSANAPGSTPSPRAVADPVESLANALLELGAPARTAVAEAAAVESVTPASSDPPAFGRLIVQALDASTNEPVRSFGVRLLSDTRFADELCRDKSGELTLPLTPDEYSLVVTARGYEPLELPRVRITDEATCAVVARLDAGAGSVHADVLGADAQERKLFVELVGANRRPCERCGDSEDPDASNDPHIAYLRAWFRPEPCRWCGFSRDRSRLPLGTSNRASFSRLASGNYALGVKDDRGFVVCQPRELVLRAGATERVTLDLSSERYVELEVVDVDGRSLADEWRSRLADSAEEEAEELVELLREGVHVIPIHLTIDSAGRRAAEASLVPPPPTGGFAFAVGGAMSKYGHGVHAQRSIVDRARQPEDSAWPTQPPARFEGRVACDLQHSGLARLGPLPSSQLELHGQASTFVAEATIPASTETTHVRSRLRQKVDDPIAVPEFASYMALEASGGQ